MTNKSIKPEVVADQDLDQAVGGVGLLLPAVQQVREAAVVEDTSDAELKLKTSTEEFSLRDTKG